MKKIIGMFLVLLSLTTNASAGGGGALTGGATLPEQIVQTGIMGDQLAKQALSVQHQFAILQDAIKNTAQLTNVQWSSASSLLNQLIQINRQAKGLAYGMGDIIGRVKTQYGDAGQTLTGLDQKLLEWNDNSNSQLASTLQAYGYQADNFASEQDALAQIQSASQSSTGRLQAIQAGNQIAGMQVNQTQLLRSAVMQGNQALLNIASQQANKDQQDRNVVNDWMKKPAKRGIW